MFNNHYLSAAQQATVTSVHTPKLTREWPSHSTSSKCISPSPRLSSQSSSLSSPPITTNMATNCDSIRLIDWGPSTGIIGTQVLSRLTLPRTKFTIRAMAILESRVLEEPLCVAAHVESVPLDTKGATEPSMLVSFATPPLPLSKDITALDPLELFVRLCLEFHEHPNLSRHTISLDVGKYVYLKREPSSIQRIDTTTSEMYKLEDPSSLPISDSTRPISTPSNFSIHQSCATIPGPGALGVIDTAPSFHSWTGSPLKNRTSIAIHNDVMHLAEYEDPDQTDSPMSMSFESPNFPMKAFTHKSNDAVTVPGSSRCGRSGRSKSYSECWPARPSEFVGHPRSHSSSLLETRLTLRMGGPLNDMMCGWTNEELSCGRRLVQFFKKLQGSTLTVYFEALPSHRFEPDHGNGIVSCIYREHPEGFFITSVDTISLIESLVGTAFPTAEKNRIRRNLQGFKPLTVTKSKLDSENFFKRIMSFQNPKPRNIEKDIKVFGWGALELALTKVLGRYTSINKGPDDPRATIRYDFQYPIRKSATYPNEALSSHTPIESNESSTSEIVPAIFSGGRSTRSSSSSDLNLSSATISNDWIHSLNNTDNPFNASQTHDLPGNPSELVYSLPWTFSTQAGSPSSSTSFDTMATIPDRFEDTKATQCHPSIYGIALDSTYNHHGDVSQLMTLPRSNFNTHGGYDDGVIPDTSYLEPFLKLSHGFTGFSAHPSSKNPTPSQNHGTTS